MLQRHLRLTPGVILIFDLISDHVQPLDQLSISMHYKALSFSALAVDLDQWKLFDSLAAEYHTEIANRFLSAHRLTINFFDKFHPGLTEAQLYGG